MTLDPDAKSIPLALIEPPNPVLRRVDEDSLIFAEMVHQIGRDGHVMNSALVRPLHNGRFQLCDGNWRRVASIAAGVETLFCIVREMNNEEYLTKQLEANATKSDTDWVEYARQLERLRHMNNSEMTLDELSSKVGKSKTWVQRILGLNKLLVVAKNAVRRGEMPLGNAKELARLPWEFQRDLFEDAVLLNTKDFRELSTKKLTKFRELIRQGKLNQLGSDKLEPRMREFRQIKDEIEQPAQLGLLLAREQICNTLEAASAALRWAFRLDDVSIQERQDKLLREERQVLEDEEKRKAERKMLATLESENESC